jgi:hypothetical protein
MFTEDIFVERIGFIQPQEYPRNIMQSEQQRREDKRPQ